MMMPSDLEKAVSWMEARWGHQKVWQGWSDFYSDFQEFPTEGMWAVLNEWFKAGNKWAPKPSELLQKLNDQYRQEWVRPSPKDCDHPEPYGFVVAADGSRRAMCRLCLSEWDAPNIRTVTEVADAKETTGVPV